MLNQNNKGRFKVEFHTVSNKSWGILFTWANHLFSAENKLFRIGQRIAIEERNMKKEFEFSSPP
jgi:hypothetical protein